MFDSGSSIGGAIAPVHRALGLSIFREAGDRRSSSPACWASRGFALFHAIYRSPGNGSRVCLESANRRLRSRAVSPATRTILRLPQTWGIVLGKALTDPVWFFITDWFAIYLVSRGFRLEDSLLAFWVPFLAADLGNFCGGGCSSALIARGWRVGAARKLVVVASARRDDAARPGGLRDVVRRHHELLGGRDVRVRGAVDDDPEPARGYLSERSVASVSGLSGTGAGVGTILATYLTGIVADRYSFRPVLIVASVIPIVAAVAIVMLVRNNGATRRGLVYPI